MEDIKEKIPMIIAVIVAIVICVGAFYFLESYEKVYYTQIDNTKIQGISATDDMKYEYTIDCYNENGKKKELKENAYLMLEVRSIGVHTWKEVQYNELPEKVKANYTE